MQIIYCFSWCCYQKDKIETNPDGAQTVSIDFVQHKEITFLEEMITDKDFVRGKIIDEFSPLRFGGFEEFLKIINEDVRLAIFEEIEKFPTDKWHYYNFFLTSRIVYSPKEEEFIWSTIPLGLQE